MDIGQWGVHSEHLDIVTCFIINQLGWPDYPSAAYHTHPQGCHLRYNAVQVFSNSTKNLSPISPIHNTSPPQQFLWPIQQTLLLVQVHGTTQSPLSGQTPLVSYRMSTMLWSVSCADLVWCVVLSLDLHLYYCNSVIIDVTQYAY